MPPRRRAACLALCAWSAVALAPAAASAEAPDGAPAPASDGPPGPPRELTLAQVLANLAEQHPRVAGADAGAEAAMDLARSAVGHWDPVFVTDADWVVSGAYPYRVVDVELQQATPLWGTRLAAGYRHSQGKLPVYKGYLQTQSGGEVYADIKVPLLRGGAIDKKRADLQLTARAADAAGYARDDLLNRLRRDASAAFWGWVAAVQQVGVEASLLALAQTRQESIDLLVHHGEVPPIERIENQRAIFQRRERYQAAARKAQSSAIKLSLFWRDDDGTPRLARPQEAPRVLPEPHAALMLDIPTDVEVATHQRPDLRAIEAKRAAAGTKVALTRNQVWPKLDVEVGLARELHNPQAVKASFEVGAHLSVPLALRQSRGQARAAQAEARRVDFERRYLRDQLTAEVRDVHSLLTNTASRWQIVGSEVHVAKAVEEAERERFRQGESSLIIVNLREQARADAAKRLIEVGAEYWTAWSTYQAVLAQLAKP